MSVRRVMNLIVDNRFPGAKSLRCVDLTRQLFDNSTPLPWTIGDGSETAPVPEPTAHTPTEALKMERVQLPSPIFTFQGSASALNEPCKVDCFPLADGKIFWSYQSRRCFLFDVKTRHLRFMPSLHKPKWMPFSVFIPKADADANHEDCGRSLFIMEKIPEPEAVSSMQCSPQFEAFVYRKPALTYASKSWHLQLLPPPPFVRDPKYRQICPEISSYTVLDGGKLICISVDRVGSYCLDTENHTWSKLGTWTLPFHGKVEYVPELNLWFGLSAKDRQLAAADLSAMDSQPQLTRTLKQLDVPEEWKECKDSQFVYLGSGRFCIARFFHALTLNHDSVDDCGQIFTVFTGVEVVPPVSKASGNASSSGNGVELQMIPRKSVCHMSDSMSIDAVF